MTVFQGAFVRASDASSGPSDMIGPGSIEIAVDRLVVRGKRPRARLANVLSVTVGVFVAFAIAVAFAFIDIHVDDVRLPGLVAVALAAAAAWAARAVLVRVLGLQSVAIAVPFVNLARAAVGERRVVIVTTMSALRGVVSFETDGAARFADELSQARARGGGYRSNAA